MPQIIKLRRSLNNTSFSTLNQGEVVLHLGGDNRETMLFAGNSANKPVLINNPPFSFSLTDTISPTVSIESNASYNLFTPLTGSDIYNATKVNFQYIKTGFSRNATNLSLVFPPFKNYTAYQMRLQLIGTLAGSSSSNVQFIVELRRGEDNSLVLQDYIIKLEGSGLDALSRQYNSFTNGLDDPYISDGLKIIINNTSGQTVSLTGYKLLIQGNATDFIQ